MSMSTLCSGGGGGGGGGGGAECTKLSSFSFFNWDGEPIN